MSFLTSTAACPPSPARSRSLCGWAERPLCRELVICASAIVLGAVLGLSSPGIEQWYLVWFGMVPLLALSVSASSPWNAWWRGLCFGTGYNLVYLLWYLSVRSVYWTGSLSFSPALQCVLSWLMMSVWQGVFVAIYSCVLRAIPMTGGWIPVKRYGRWLAPSFVVVPIAWLLITDKLGNAPDFLGVPWSMLQYSQYKELPILQCACIIGGVGIGFLIMLTNVTIAGVLGWQRKSLSGLSYTSCKSLLVNTGASVIMLLLVLAFGYYRLSRQEQQSSAGKLRVSAIQASLVEKIHHVSAQAVANKYLDLVAQCPPGLCIWPEWAVAIDYTRDTTVLRNAAKFACRHKQSWVLGMMDSGGVGKEYNTVAAVNSNGILVPWVYHKRYLVPFGEYTPDWVRHSIVGLLLFGINGEMVNTDAGHTAAVFRLKEAAVTPVICFENLIPRFVCEGVRSGAELIVDCSNTSWFHKSILSDQMVAFCVMRAAENHRPFVFATTLGPSTIIDPFGRIVRQAPREQSAAITANVTLPRDLTPFTRWCF